MRSLCIHSHMNHRGVFLTHSLSIVQECTANCFDDYPKGVLHPFHSIAVIPTILPILPPTPLSPYLDPISNKKTLNSEQPKAPRILAQDKKRQRSLVTDLFRPLLVLYRTC